MSQQPPNVVLQNIRKFTVQVRDSTTKATVGTAFIVSRDDGLLVTCRHVVDVASPDLFGEGARVWVYFSQLPVGEEKLRSARVIRYFRDHDDDVVVLQLETLPLPTGVGVAILGTAPTVEER